MRKEVLWGKRSLQFYYYRYKDSPYYSFFIFFFVIIVCSILIFNIIIPQLSNWFSIRKEVEATRGKIATIKNNINIMNNIDKVVLDSQFQIAAAALPPEKDFIVILNAISDSAIHSGVSFDDFNFQVGATNSSDLLVVQMTLVIQGGLKEATRFVHEIEAKLPVSEVVYLSGSGQSISVNIRFYQKPFSKTVLRNDEPIIGLSDKKRELLQKLSSWKPMPVAAPISASSTASESSVPLF